MKPDKNKLDVKSVTGADIYAILPDLARLRMVVFRDWPYLYDGTLEYEEKYLANFAAAKGAVVITAYDGKDMVGASTAAPMVSTKPAMPGKVSVVLAMAMTPRIISTLITSATHA